VKRRTWLRDSVRLMRGKVSDVRLTPMNRVFLFDRRDERPIYVRLSGGRVVGQPTITDELSEKETERLVNILTAQAEHRARAAEDVWEFNWNDEI